MGAFKPRYRPPEVEALARSGSRGGLAGRRAIRDLHAELHNLLEKDLLRFGGPEHQSYAKSLVEALASTRSQMARSTIIFIYGHAGSPLTFQEYLNEVLERSEFGEKPGLFRRLFPRKST